MRLEDNEIIKALECCLQEYGNCDDCPYKEYQCVSEKDGNVFYKDILDLINRQKAENDELQLKIASCNTEIERLKMEIEALDDAIYPLPFKTDFDIAIETAKTEAIREFAERLKKEAFKPLGTWFTEKVITENKVDNLVKEMVGE